MAKCCICYDRTIRHYIRFIWEILVLHNYIPTLSSHCIWKVVIDCKSVGSHFGSASSVQPLDNFQLTNTYRLGLCYVETTYAMTQR